MQNSFLQVSQVEQLEEKLKLMKSEVESSKSLKHQRLKGQNIRAVIILSDTLMRWYRCREHMITELAAWRKLTPIAAGSNRYETRLFHHIPEIFRLISPRYSGSDGGAKTETLVKITEKKWKALLNPLPDPVHTQP